MYASDQTTTGARAQTAPPGARTEMSGLTWRSAGAAVLLGVTLIVLTALAIRYTEMVTGRYVSHGVPPLPAFAAVLFLSLMCPLLQRHAPRFCPSRAQILLVYVMVATATILSGAYQIRAFLPHLVAMQYHGRDGGVFADLAQYLPSWYAPQDRQAILDYYNGIPGKPIPWGAWAIPLAAWSLFLIAIFIAAWSLVTLVQRQWMQNEKLSFPLLQLPLAMTAESHTGFGPNRRLLFVAGFGVAGIFNGLNILHVLYPTVPSPGFYLPLGEYFPNRPWIPFGSIIFFFMIEAIGIGYFMPLEVLFSTWFFYFANRVGAVIGSAAGYDQPGYPYTQEQSAGGYLAAGLLLLWSLRSSLTDSLRRCFTRAGRTAGADTVAERWAWIGLGGSSLFALGFASAAGFSLRLSLPYFAVLGLFVLVYTRIRAETGVPYGFIYPYTLPKEIILNTISVPGALNIGGKGSFVLFSSMAWLSRHHLPEEHAAYQFDGMKLAQEARIGRAKLFAALAVAFVVGLAAAYWIHLDAYYTIGTNLAGGGTGTGEYREIVAFQEYQQMATRIANPPERDLPRLFAVSGGFLFTCSLYWLRRAWLGSPFHPLGFILATCYGDSGTMWFAMLVAWTLKAFILRAGGLRLYRQGMPFFLGLAIGHFFLAGIFWPVFSLFIAPEASRAYHLYFGG